VEAVGSPLASTLSIAGVCAPAPKALTGAPFITEIHRYSYRIIALGPII